MANLQNDGIFSQGVCSATHPKTGCQIKGKPCKGRLLIAAYKAQIFKLEQEQLKPQRCLQIPNCKNQTKLEAENFVLRLRGSEAFCQCNAHDEVALQHLLATNAPAFIRAQVNSCHIVLHISTQLSWNREQNTMSRDTSNLQFDLGDVYC